MTTGKRDGYEPLRGPPPDLSDSLKMPHSPRAAATTSPPPSNNPFRPARPPAVTQENRAPSAQSSVSLSPVPFRTFSPPPSAGTYNTATSAAAGGAPAGGTRRHQALSPTSNIDLHHVLASGPHELEAETNLLRAVEKITGQAHQKTNTETFELFSTIAEDEIVKTMVEDNDQQQQPPPPPKQSKPAQENASAVSGTTTTTAEFQGLIQKTTEIQMAATKGDGTVEETLFGLANALNDLGDHHSSAKQQQQVTVGDDFSTSLPAVDKLAATIDEHILNADEENNADHTTTSVSEAFTDQTTSNGTAAAAVDGDNKAGNDKKKKKRTRRRNRHRHRRRAKKIVNAASSGMKEDFELFQEFVGGQRQSAQSYAKKVVLFVVLPSLLMAALLFYFVESPKVERLEDGSVKPGQPATVSWWFLFLGVRVVITFTMAIVTQALVIDFLALGSRFSLQWLGPVVTLLVVQSKGWPFLATFWGTYTLVLLSGTERYVRHWLYMQDQVSLFNEDNPGNFVLDNKMYIDLLQLMILSGVLGAIKRLVVGLLLGRQTFAHYGQDLAKVMKNMVLVGEVATLGREIEKDKEDFVRERTAASMRARSLTDEWAPNAVSDFVNKEADAALEAEEAEARNSAMSPTATEAANAFMAKQRESGQQQQQLGSSSMHAVPAAPGDTVAAAGNAQTGLAEAPPQDFTDSEQYEIAELLDAWEEPKRAEESEERKITLGAIMQFRQALSFMKRKYPFLPAFGPADTRERCIESSQAVYDRLLLRTPHLENLPFETLALLAKDGDGGINQDKAKELIKIFRPERDGSLGKLEFVKSVDTIWKDLRLLSANITNSSQIDKAIESLVNFVFYGFLACLLLTAVGGSPATVYLSFSSAILGFSFMFGGTSAKYFEGLLFILVQRPYGVGDRIHLSNPQNETSADGSSGWIVEKVTLTTTTVYWGTTNERATLNNGAISNLRVINAARSPNATVFVELKFGIDTAYEKIAIFRTAVEQFLKDRPREWLTFVGFRPTEVAVDRGFLGYKIIAQHRNHWQGIGGILTSKADLTSYCMEVARMLEIRYQSPPLPVDLSMKGTAASALKALHPPTELDQTQILAALEANSPKKRGMRGQHEGFHDE